eukprot:4620899-Amphidinium_carterae.1
MKASRPPPAGVSCHDTILHGQSTKHNKERASTVDTLSVQCESELTRLTMTLRVDRNAHSSRAWAS